MAHPSATPRPAPDTLLQPVDGDPASNPGSLEPGELVDRYEIQGVLGTGASGIVYRVRHRTLGTVHALKVLTWAHPQLQARLLSEGRAQASVHHPNVVPVTDLLEVSGAPALLMDLVEGPSLERWLEEHRPDIPEAEALFRAILAGVEAAHARGIVHRDLKPANVLMERTADGWTPRVTDFGLAKWTESDLGLTRTGMTMGTPGYMAPEQIRCARTVDHRADIFALGCLLYELLTGEAPHAGTDPLTVMNAVAEGQVRPVQTLVPRLPRRLLNAVRWSMAREVEERAPTCAALRACLDGAPVRLPSSWRPRGPWRRSAGLFVAVLAGVGIGVLTGAGMSLALSATAEPAPAAVRPMDRLEAVLARWSPADAAGEATPVDDVDPTLRPPPEAPAPEEAPPDGETAAPPSSAVSLPSPSSSRRPPTTGQTLGCPHDRLGDLGVVALPRLWLRPRDGIWSPSRPLEVHEGPDGAVRCTLPAEASLILRDEPVRVGGRRWLAVGPDDVVLPDP